MRKINLIIVFVITISLAFIGISFIRNKEKSNCGLIVFVKDELSIDANQVNHYSSGFTTVELCDGKRLIYRSDLIIKVVEK